MAYNLLTPERDQLYLLPPSMADWLPEDHLAWFVLDAVEEMDLSAFYADYRADGWGGAAHDPAAMVALLLYAYCVGVRSSRQIERACHVDVAFRVICAGLLPDHTTIARFRQRHEEVLKMVFTASLRLCAQAGMAGVGLVALDGTKMAAPASMERNVTKDTIDEAVEKLFAEAKATDEAEDAKFGGARGDEPPAALRGREDRRRRFKAAKEVLDKELDAKRAAHEAHLAERAREEERQGHKLRGRKPKAPEEKAGHKDKKVNTTDPESKVMSTKNGFLQGYNAQAVANEDQVILSAEVTDEQNDKAQLHPGDRRDQRVTREGRHRRPTREAPRRRQLRIGGELRRPRRRRPRQLRGRSQYEEEPDPAHRPARSAEEGRDLGRQDGPQDVEQVGSGSLQAAPGDHRADLRPDQGRPRDPFVHAERQEGGGLGVEAHLRHPQPLEALPPRPCKAGHRALQPVGGAGGRMKAR